MLIHSASQLITLSGGVQPGLSLGRLGIIPDGAVLVHGDHILEVGRSSDLLYAYPDEPRFDASQKVVLPGFVDPHTHLVWAGDRAAEFELRTQGKTYPEIQAAGGGILSTVLATRQAPRERLIAETRLRAQALFEHGTTTAEAKTGYGLEISTELNLLGILTTLDDEGPLEIVPTFLAAHAIPPEYEEDADGYTDLICRVMLPKVKVWWQKNRPNHRFPFVDVFCDQGAFSLAQAQRVLETARELSFPLKIHADEFEAFGATPMAVTLGAISVDHLVKTSPEDLNNLGKSNTVAVSLPCTPFGLAEPEYTPARQLLEAGGVLAIGTDLNPGTAWCENMQFAIALACRYLHLTPAEAIAAATINAATALQLQDRIGSIEPGKQADLILLKTDDYRHLGYRFGINLVSHVIKKGKVFQV
jgi:imidazolonepropionase